MAKGLSIKIFLLTIVCFCTQRSYAQEAESSDGQVLVLGSGGLIGRSMLKWLAAHNYEVLEVKNRNHIDLRVRGALDQFNDKKISFVVFLACEVGGSKFIDSSQGSHQLEILEHNTLIYQTVFPWLQKRQIPFVFASSYLQSQPNAYGTIKRLGEAWMRALGFGKIVRLWNIYGHEKIGLKSHVLTDWVSQCIYKQHIECRTTGQEPRQFLHADDTANAIGAVMTHYSDMDDVNDVSYKRWITLRDAAEMIMKDSKVPCTIAYSDVIASARNRTEPNWGGALHKVWKAEIEIEDGIKRLFSEYESEKQSTVTSMSVEAGSSHWLAEGDQIIIKEEL